MFIFVCLDALVIDIEMFEHSFSISCNRELYQKSNGRVSREGNLVNFCCFLLTCLIIGFRLAAHQAMSNVNNNNREELNENIAEIIKFFFLFRRSEKWNELEQEMKSEEEKISLDI